MSPCSKSPVKKCRGIKHDSISSLKITPNGYSTYWQQGSIAGRPLTVTNIWIKTDPIHTPRSLDSNRTLSCLQWPWRSLLSSTSRSLLLPSLFSLSLPSFHKHRHLIYCSSFMIDIIFFSPPFLDVSDLQWMDDFGSETWMMNKLIANTKKRDF